MLMCSCILKQAELECSLGSGWNPSLGGSLGKLASHLCSLQSSFFSLTEEQASVHAFLKSGVQAFHSLSVSPTGSPTSQGGSFHVLDPMTVVPSMWLNPLSPQGGPLPMQFPESSPSDTSPNLVTCLPFLINIMYIFLSALTV